MTRPILAVNGIHVSPVEIHTLVDPRFDPRPPLLEDLRDGELVAGKHYVPRGTRYDEGGAVLEVVLGVVLPRPGCGEDAAPFEVVEEGGEEVGGELPEGAVGVEGGEEDGETGELGGLVVGVEGVQVVEEGEEDGEEGGEGEEGDEGHGRGVEC